MFITCPLIGPIAHAHGVMTIDCVSSLGGIEFN